MFMPYQWVNLEAEKGFPQHDKKNFLSSGFYPYKMINEFISTIKSLSILNTGSY